MKLLLHVFIDDFSRYHTETNWETQRYWDDYGASLAIDNAITDFPENKFVKPQTINYTVTGAKAKNYSWAVSVASFAERNSLRLTKFPTIMFYDVDTAKYVARLEGTPHTSSDVAEILRLLLKGDYGQNGNGGGTSGGTMTETTKKTLGFGFLGALALLLFRKKPNQKGPLSIKAKKRR